MSEPRPSMEISDGDSPPASVSARSATPQPVEAPAKPSPPRTRIVYTVYELIALYDSPLVAEEARGVRPLHELFGQYVEPPFAANPRAYGRAPHSPQGTRGGRGANGFGAFGKSDEGHGKKPFNNRSEQTNWKRREELASRGAGSKRLPGRREEDDDDTNKPSWMEEGGSSGGAPAWMDAPATGGLTFASDGRVVSESHTPSGEDAIQALVQKKVREGGLDQMQAFKLEMRLREDQKNGKLVLDEPSDTPAGVPSTEVPEAAPVKSHEEEEEHKKRVAKIRLLPSNKDGAAGSGGIFDGFGIGFNLPDGQAKAELSAPKEPTPQPKQSRFAKFFDDKQTPLAPLREAHATSTVPQQDAHSLYAQQAAQQAAQQKAQQDQERAMRNSQLDALKALHQREEKVLQLREEQAAKIAQQQAAQAPQGGNRNEEMARLFNMLRISQTQNMERKQKRLEEERALSQQQAARAAQGQQDPKLQAQLQQAQLHQAQIKQAHLQQAQAEAHARLQLVEARIQEQVQAEAQSKQGRAPQGRAPQGGQQHPRVALGQGPQAQAAHAQQTQGHAAALHPLHAQQGPAPAAGPQARGPQAHLPQQSPGNPFPFPINIQRGVQPGAPQQPYYANSANAAAPGAAPLPGYSRYPGIPPPPGIMHAPQGGAWPPPPPPGIGMMPPPPPHLRAGAPARPLQPQPPQ